MHSKKLLVFDFDGVLLRSHEQMYQAISAACERYSLPRLSVDELRKCSSQELIDKLKIGTLRAFQMTRFCRNYLEALEFEGVDQNILRLLESESRTSIMGIVSSSSQKRIERFLQKEKIGSYFKFIDASVGLWGKSQRLASLSKQYSGLIHLYFGDEDRDILAAKKARYSSIAVGWGAKDPDFLKRAGPTYFVNTPEQLERLLKAFD